MGKRSAKRVRRPLKMICEVCEVEFVVPLATNYDYGRCRKTCSEGCRRIYQSRKNSRSYREKQAKVKAAKAVKAAKPKSDRVNIYKMVHEKALEFAGVSKYEGYDDE